jgi:hypothetical protein
MHYTLGQTVGIHCLRLLKANDISSALTGTSVRMNDGQCPGQKGLVQIIHCLPHFAEGYHCPEGHQRQSIF